MKKPKLVLIFEIITEVGNAGWSSTLNILYLLVYSYAFFIATFYYSGDVSSAFTNIITFLSNNWGYFWIMFFSSKLYNTFKWGW